MLDHVPRGLLARAWLRFTEGDLDAARGDLDEVWQLAERGPMLLFQADVHLYRAGLFHATTPYPWDSPKEDLQAARALVERCGYRRRKEELEDAEYAARDWNTPVQTREAPKGARPAAKVRSRVGSGKRKPKVATAEVSLTSRPLTLWREKLEFLLSQEAIAVDPDQKFRLRKLIDEARAKIREHGGHA
jgi:hypothetical protein